MISNKTIDLILRMRDQASAVWSQVHGKITSGARDMASKLRKNWLQVTALAAGAALSIRKAFDFTEAFAQTEQSRQAFRGMLTSMGKDADQVFNELRQKSAGLIDEKSLLESANRAISLGIPVERLGDLMEVARAKARDMGITTSQAFNDIATGIGRASPLIIDNLGIAVKLGEANNRLAASLGKTSQELTDVEKKQALLNAVLDAGTEAVERHNLQQLTLSERLQRAKALIADAQLIMGQFITRGGLVLHAVGTSIARVFFELASVVLMPLAAIEKGLNLLGVTSSTKLQRTLDVFTRSARAATSQAAESFQLAFASADEFAQAMGGSAGPTQSMEDFDEETKGASGSLKEMKENLKKLEAEFDTVSVGTRRFEQLRIEIARLKALIEEASKGPAEQFATSVSTAMDTVVRSGQDAAARFMEATSTMFGAGVSEEELQQVRDQIAITGEMRRNALVEQKGEELVIIDEWEQKAVEMANENQELITEIHRVASERRAQISRESARQAWSTWLGLASDAIGTISQLQQNAHQARINAIMDERDQRLAAIDAELSADGLSEARKKQLLEQREQFEQQYNQRVAEAKRKAFEAEKRAAIIQAIINTAVSVTKVLWNPILAIAVGALGAAQVAIIASQPTPRFHQGGTVGEHRPVGEEIQILAQAGETIRTIQQESDLQNQIDTIFSRIKTLRERSTRRSLDIAERTMVGLTAEAGVSGSVAPILSRETALPRNIQQERRQERAQPAVNITVNINAPGTPAELVKEALEEGLRRSGLTIDKYVTQNKNNLRIIR